MGRVLQAIAWLIGGVLSLVVIAGYLGPHGLEFFALVLVVGGAGGVWNNLTERHGSRRRESEMLREMSGRSMSAAAPAASLSSASTLPALGDRLRRASLSALEGKYLYAMLSYSDGAAGAADRLLKRMSQRGPREKAFEGIINRAGRRPRDAAVLQAYIRTFVRDYPEKRAGWDRQPDLDLGMVEPLLVSWPSDQVL